MPHNVTDAPMPKTKYRHARRNRFKYADAERLFSCGQINVSMFHHMFHCVMLDKAGCLYVWRWSIGRKCRKESFVREFFRQFS